MKDKDKVEVDKKEKGTKTSLLQQPALSTPVPQNTTKSPVVAANSPAPAALVAKPEPAAKPAAADAPAPPASAGGKSLQDKIREIRERTAALKAKT